MVAPPPPRHKARLPNRPLQGAFFVMITIAVPPALPACLTIATVFSIGRLRKRGIYVTSPDRITVAGQLDVICFDKTGARACARAPAAKLTWHHRPECTAPPGGPTHPARERGHWLIADPKAVHGPHGVWLNKPWMAELHHGHKAHGHRLSIPCPSRSPPACLLPTTPRTPAGTLTEQGLDLQGIVPIAGGSIYGLVSQMELLPLALVELLASCHGLARMGEALVGDPLDQVGLMW